MTNTQFKEVYAHIEEALNAYHDLHNLSSSPLASLLSLEDVGWSGNEAEPESSTEISGSALHNLLDTVIDSITLMPRYSVVAEQTWRLEDYLHLRYRERIPHATIAQSLGYSELHMARLRDELMAEAAELILEKIG